MLDVPRESHAKYELNTSKDKAVVEYHCSCHGNLVAVAMNYAAHPKKLHTKYELNRTQGKRDFQVSLWLPW